MLSPCWLLQTQVADYSPKLTKGGNQVPPIPSKRRAEYVAMAKTVEGDTFSTQEFVALIAPYGEDAVRAAMGLASGYVARFDPLVSAWHMPASLPRPLPVLSCSALPRFVLLCSGPFACSLPDQKHHPPLSACGHTTNSSVLLVTVPCSALACSAASCCQRRTCGSGRSAASALCCAPTSCGQACQLTRPTWRSRPSWTAASSLLT
jgi:hypothetical protein